MNQPETTHWACPICQLPLHRQEAQYPCGQGHCFDRAREGYVNLLPAHRKHSARPGDDRAMLQARRAFLEADHYRSMADEVAGLCVALGSEAADASPALLDIGCGEGYYTGHVLAALRGVAPTAWVGGIDISKDAVRMAARRYTEAEFAVASSAALPVPDASLDLATQIFAPRTDTELCRVLRPGGRFVQVTPGPRHLYQLRELIYDTPREHPERIPTVEGLAHQQRVELDYELRLENAQDVARLLAMTPYYWQASEQKQQAIAALEGLRTEVAFRIDVYGREPG